MTPRIKLLNSIGWIFYTHARNKDILVYPLTIEWNLAICIIGWKNRIAMDVRRWFYWKANRWDSITWYKCEKHKWSKWHYKLENLIENLFGHAGAVLGTASRLYILWAGSCVAMRSRISPWSLAIAGLAFHSAWDARKRSSLLGHSSRGGLRELRFQEADARSLASIFLLAARLDSVLPGCGPMVCRDGATVSRVSARSVRKWTGRKHTKSPLASWQRSRSVASIFAGTHRVFSAVEFFSARNRARCLSRSPLRKQ